MPKISFSSHPNLLGFEQLEQLLERSVNSPGDSFPPYNIEQLGSDAFRISLAVAGFLLEDLSVIIEGSQLIVSGQQRSEQTGREFVHQGIAARQFRRVFVLADCIETTNARLQNGLLILDLVRRPQKEKIQKISINGNG